MSQDIVKRHHDEIARLAYLLWERRGRPVGSPDIDWFRAEHELLSEINTGNRLPFSSIQMGPTSY
jgi:hypothetical protein